LSNQPKSQTTFLPRFLDKLGWLLVFVTSLACATPPEILLVATSRTATYTNFIEGFSLSLAADGDETHPYQVEFLFLDEEDFNSQQINANTRLLITVGTRAARIIAQQDIGIPVLNTLIPESAYSNISATAASCAQHSAIFIDQPVQRQIILAGALFPGADKYGVLLGEVSSRRKPEVKDIADRTGLDIIIREHSGENGPEWLTRELVEETDLLIAISDPVALNRTNAKWLLYTAYQHLTPVIGFSQAYVKAGAAAAVYSTPQQIGRQAARLVADTDLSEDFCLPGPMYPDEYSVSMNRGIVRSLGGKENETDELIRLIQESERSAP
jgi:putative ABC transport system substrate-binding protein